MALVLAMLLLAALAVPAMAADTTYKIAIKNETSGFTYNAYQIFTGDLSGSVLSNVQWGTGISQAGKDALYNRYGLDGTEGKEKTAAKVAEKIAAVGSTEADKKAEADAIATLIAKTTTGGLGTAIAMSYSDSITVGSETFKGYKTAADQVAGYYLIVNSGVPTGDDKTFSDYIVEVVQDVAVAPKSGKPESEKKVDDINDSTGATGEKQDSADHDIGDTISYTLTAKLPGDYANYDKYYLQFQDDMSGGLTLNTDSVKIFYGSSDTTGTAITFTAAEGTSYTTAPVGQLYTYTIADVKTTASSLGAGDVITITYTATLNANAKIGEAGNPNKYRIEYSNNPNNAGEGKPTSTTPWDINIVFTYKTVFNKEDGTTHKPLTGADFELFKFIKSESGTETYKTVKGDWVNVTALHTGTGAVNPTKTKSAHTDGTDSADNAKFTFAGLDDGYYKLQETATPPGYNSVDDVYFTITAEHEVKTEDPKLTSLSGAEGTTFTMTAVKSEGSLTSKIDNNKGSTLPETGGIGTTIFYVAGSILVLAAAILLITKRRMGNND